MTPEDWFALEETLRDLHARSHMIFFKDKCAECGRVWPCDTIRTLDNVLGWVDGG